MSASGKLAAAVKRDREAKPGATIVRRAEASSAPASKPGAIITTGGRPLPVSVRTFMEPRFGANFGNVRIHTGQASAQQNLALSAHAFTVGEHVFFGRNQFQPDNSSGRELIAHELTHVLQQRGGQSDGGIVRSHVSEPGGIQRDGDGSSSPLAWLGEKVADLVDFGESAGWSLLDRFAPDLVPIVRGGPGAIVDWIQGKAEAAAEAALDAIAAPVRALGGAGNRLAARFAPMAAAIQQAAGKIARNDCTPLREAAEKIEATATAIIQPIVEFLQPIVAKVKGFLDDAWQLIGAPMWEWIKRRAAEHWAAIQWLWDKIKAVAGWIWKNTENLRTLVGKAWTWFKNKLGIGEGPEGENGLLQWVQAKVEAAWNAIKVKLEPYRQQIMAVALAVGGVLLMVSPAGPIIAIGAAVAGAIQGLRWIHANWGKGDAIVRARQYLEQSLIPVLTSALDRVMAAVSRAAAALAKALGSIAAGMSHAAAAIQNSVLKLAAGAVQWLAAQAQALSDWATGGLASLNASLRSALSGLRSFLGRVLKFLGAVGRAVVDVWKIPALVVGQIWDAIPACIRDPVADFLGRLILGQIELFQELVRDNEAWQQTKKDVLNIIKLVFTDGDLMGALHATFDLILRVFNIDKELLVEIKTKALAAWDVVVKKPLAFIKNLIRSIGVGFRRLGENFRSHLEYGLKEWLLGPLAEKGVKPPDHWDDAREVFNFALDVMGISVDNVFKLIGERIGEDKAKKLKDRFRHVVRAISLISELIDVNKSPAENTKGIIDRAKNFGKSILTGIAEWVAGRVAAEIAEMAVAAAASAGLSEVLDIARRIYRALVTAKRYARRVLEMVNKSLDNVLLIASGSVEVVGAKIEEILHRGMPVVIGFLADQVGLGGITQAIRDIIDDLRATVDDAIRWLIDKVRAALDAIIGAVKAGVAALREWWRKKVAIGDASERHVLQFDGSAENSKLMVHSDTQPVEAFVTRFQQVKEAEKDVSDANSLSKKIDDLLSKYRDAKKQKDNAKADDLAQQISDATDSLGKVLSSLLTRDKPTEKPEGKPVYGTGKLPGSDDTVGMSMVVDWLSPKHPVGTKPESGEHKNLMNLLETDPSESSPDKFIRGHLLNENLGGPGVAKNMFPITGKANSQHLHSTEKHIKTWLEDQSKKPKNKKDQRWVYYEVNVHVISSSLNLSVGITQNYVNSVFICRAILKDESGKPEQEFSTSVPSTYNVRTLATRSDSVVDGKKAK